MTLGKRSRPSMRRNTSMSVLSKEFTLENEKERSDPLPPVPAWVAEGKRELTGNEINGKKTQKSCRTAFAEDNVDVQWIVSSESASVVMPSFLRACGLCNKRLGSGRDTFMYRGEIAFCSLECRQHRIAIDERKEKCSLASIKKTPSRATTRTKPSNGFNTTAA